jgi:hypothetical protein
MQLLITRQAAPVFHRLVCSISATISPTDQSLSLTPAAIAGVIFNVVWIFTKLYQTVYSATMWQWSSNFFEKRGQPSEATRAQIGAFGVAGRDVIGRPFRTKFLVPRQSRFS